MEQWVTRTLALAGVSAILACGGSTAPTQTTASSEDFGTALAGASETPAVSTSATGTAAFVYEGDSVRYTIDVTGLSGITDVKLYSGAAGATGPARVTLYHTDTATAAINGNLKKGVFRAADVTGAAFTDVLSQMRSGGQAYVNVLTTANPSGAIRGELGSATPNDPFFVLRRGN